MENLIPILKSFISSLSFWITMTNSERLYQEARASIGKDMSPTQSEFGCAEAVSSIIRILLPDFPLIPGTYTLWELLKKDHRFSEIEKYEVGAIIISPTGTSEISGNISGHVGICGKHQIISNNSNTGLVDTHITKDIWDDYFGTRLRFPIYYFKLV